MKYIHICILSRVTKLVEILGFVFTFYIPVREGKFCSYAFLKMYNNKKLYKIDTTQKRWTLDTRH